MFRSHLIQNIFSSIRDNKLTVREAIEILGEDANKYLLESDINELLDLAYRNHPHIATSNRDQNDKTPLMVAAELHNFNAIKWLFEAKKNVFMTYDPRIELVSKEENNPDALSYAVMRKDDGKQFFRDDDLPRFARIVEEYLLHKLLEKHKHIPNRFLKAISFANKYGNLHFLNRMPFDDLDNFIKTVDDYFLLLESALKIPSTKLVLFWFSHANKFSHSPAQTRNVNNYNSLFNQILKTEDFNLVSKFRDMSEAISFAIDFELIINYFDNTNNLPYIQKLLGTFPMRALHDCLQKYLLSNNIKLLSLVIEEFNSRNDDYFRKQENILNMVFTAIQISSHEMAQLACESIIKNNFSDQPMMDLIIAQAKIQDESRIANYFIAIKDPSPVNLSNVDKDDREHLIKVFGKAKEKNLRESFAMLDQSPYKPAPAAMLVKPVQAETSTVDMKEKEEMFTSFCAPVEGLPIQAVTDPFAPVYEGEADIEELNDEDAIEEFKANEPELVLQVEGSGEAERKEAERKKVVIVIEDNHEEPGNQPIVVSPRVLSIFARPAESREMITAREWLAESKKHLDILANGTDLNAINMLRDALTESLGASRKFKID